MRFRWYEDNSTPDNLTYGVKTKKVSCDRSAFSFDLEAAVLLDPGAQFIN